MSKRISRVAVLCAGFKAAAIAFAASALAGGSASAAPVLDRVHSFCSESECTDGIVPFGPLVGDEKGRVFGTTQAGGESGLGVIFELSPKSGGRWKYEVICSVGQSNCPDTVPSGDLVIDNDGNLYGTSGGNNATRWGSVFELKHGHRGWTYSVLYNFCSKDGCADGMGPAAGLTYYGQSSRLLYDGTSPLFGTATTSDYTQGIVFTLVRNGSKWSESVIHKFPAGTTTTSPLLMDTAGNLYGTGTSNKTSRDFFFRLAHDTWKFDILHQFCTLADCTDGIGPRGRPVMVANGTIFGVTQSGGQYSNGTVYSLTPVKRGYKFRVVYDFCFSGVPCSDGRNPYNVTIDPSGSGSLVGATGGGGAHDGGTLFRLENGKAESVLCSFCAANSNHCPDGADPSSGVIVDDKGRIFGGTFYGGKTSGENVPLGAGIVYELVP
jgi:uncharacterized repeat protein (TIGR03803 family)